MEVDHDFIRRDGFFFDEQSFRLDLYRLLSCFFSSSEFARLRDHLDLEQIADIGDEFEENEITRLLVNIAVKIRIVQDRESEYFNRIKGICGKLITDLDKPRIIEELLFREACNKIIHAKNFKFDVEKIKIKYRGNIGTENALRPFIHLYGEKNNVQWKAILNIVKFCKAGAIHVKG